MKITEVEISNIEILENTRVSMKDQDMIELMASIKQDGLLQPIGVSSTPSKKMILVYGNRRLVACKKLGWSKIPAIVGDEKSLKDHILHNITENLQRVNNTPHELGRICSKLVKEMHMTVGELAVRLNTSKGKIQAAIDTFGLVPSHLKDRVKFMNAGTNGSKSGDIPASLVQRVMALKYQHDLRNEEVEQLLDMSQQGLMGVDRLTLIASLLKAGLTPKEAIKNLDIYTYVPVKNIIVEKRIIEKLTKKHKVSGTMIIKRILYGEMEPLEKPYFVDTQRSIKPAA